MAVTLYLMKRMVYSYVHDFNLEHFNTYLGTEELGHMEIICAIVHQLTRNLTPQEIVASGFDKYYVDHTLGLWPQSAGGAPFSSTVFQSKGDPITDLTEDLAAEQKARTTYDNILRLVHDQDICDPIRFLREREIVHFQRFGEAKREVSSKYPGSEKPTTMLLLTTNYKKKRCMKLSRT